MSRVKLLTPRPRSGVVALNVRTGAFNLVAGLQPARA